MLTSSPSNSDEVLLHHFSDGVLTLTLNRPQRLNALTPTLMRRLRALVAEAASDPRVCVVVVAGSGRAFCTGGDMKHGRSDPDLPDELKQASATAEFRFDQLRGFAETVVLLHQMPKPTISMVRGPVLGAGIGLALCCDFRIFSSTTTIHPAFARTALSGDFGTGYFLGRLVGIARAQEIFLTDEKLDADAIRALGLASKVVPDDQLEAETDKLARQLAAGPTVAYRAMKENFKAAGSGNLAASIDIEVTNMIRCSLTDDHRDAVRAFAESRRASIKIG